MRRVRGACLLCFRRQPSAPCSPAGRTASVDAQAAAEMRLASELGETTFTENTKILKALALRGLRAFAVAALGITALALALRRRRRQLATDNAAATAPAALPGHTDDASGSDDPTQRYLAEMRSLGFDVDTLEDELAAERAAKAHRP